MKAGVEAGEVGRLLTVRITSRDPKPHPVSYVLQAGGLFKDMTIHDLDVARWITGSEARSVYVVGKCLVDPNIAGLIGSDAIDTVTILIEFESDVAVTIENCRRCDYGYDQRLEVYGSKGTLRAENVHPTSVQFWAAGHHGAADLPSPFGFERYSEAFKIEATNFCRAVAENKEPNPGGVDGRKALLLAMACDTSLAEKRPVFLSEFDAEYNA